MAEAVTQVSSGEVRFLSPYQNPRLVTLANYMLRSGGSRVSLNARASKKTVVGDVGSVLLYSGGIYSYIALCRELLLGRKVVVVHLAQGPVQVIVSSLERAWLRESPDDFVSRDFAKIYETLGPTGQSNVDLSVSTVSVSRDGSTIYIPDQLFDLFYVLKGAELAAEFGIPRVVMGKTSVTYDARVQRDLSAILTDFYGKKIAVESPFHNDSPAVTIQAHLERGFLKETIQQDTFSCEDSTCLIRHCGECWGCYRRMEVFNHFGWPLKPYAKLPWEGPTFHQHADRWRRITGSIE
jgi:hypothetical protein